MMTSNRNLMTRKARVRAATQDEARQARYAVWCWVLAIGAALFAFAAFAQEARPTSSKEGVVLSLNGPVTPASADYLVREIELADEANKELIVLEIDTPGGLVDSMKSIIKAVLASETPVATFVSPQGARSASAGLYIMYSAHVSAMAPATNTGAATPVEIGGAPSDEDSFGDENPFEDIRENGPEDEVTGDETAADGATEENASEDSAVAAAPVDAPTPVVGERGPSDTPPLGNSDALRAKVINDSVAYIRALAEERGRNADWAERAVREAVSVTSREALELGVIDLIADDLDDLLRQIDGKEVKTAGGLVVLNTSDLIIERIEPTLIEKILGFFANPNVAVILMSLGTTGLIIEMWNPGSIFPGVTGAICLLLGFYSFQVLPYNALPLALMALGAFLIIIEAYTPTFGIAGLVGLAVFGAGAYFLFPEEFRVAPSLIATLMAAGAAFLGLILFALLGSRGQGPMIGAEAIRKREGVVDDWDGREGWVIVEGERWRARADKPLQPGDKVRVVDVDGLVLVVRQAKGQPMLSSAMERLAQGRAAAKNEA